MSILWRAANTAVAVALVLGAGMRAVPVAAQQQVPTGLPPLSSSPISAPSGVPHAHDQGMDDDVNPMAATAHERMIHQANEQRHKRMLDDANKMVQLSNELKADVEKTQKDELSIEVMKKAAEVEKLAHDVQQRMKQ
jgi:hypothetical protein